MVARDKKNHPKCCLGKLKRKRLLYKLGIDASTILKWILEKYALETGMDSCCSSDDPIWGLELL
jgi:hypothetical protein